MTPPSTANSILLSLILSSFPATPTLILCSIPTKYLFSRLSFKRAKKPSLTPIPAPIESSGPLYYEPFTHGDEIRLLVLHAGGFDETIRCELLHVRLDEKPAYDALSYVWGTEQDTDDVVVNGCRHRIGRNLFLALKYLRLEGGERRIWLDALCINQRRPRAWSPGWRIWLGLSNEFTEATFSVLDRFVQTERQTLRFDENTEKHFVSLCSRPYWGRLWIIQEVVLTAKLAVHCGTLDISWDTFSTFAYENPEALDEIRDSGVSSLCRQRLAAKPKSHAQRSLNSLMALMHIHIQAQCGDVRDKMYGLHSFAPDCCRQAIPVDYTCSAYELCGRILIHEILEHGPRPDTFIVNAARLHHVLVRGCLEQQGSNMAFDIGRWETSLSKISHKAITIRVAIHDYGTVIWTSPPLNEIWSNGQDFEVPVDLIHHLETDNFLQTYSMEKLATSHNTLKTFSTLTEIRPELESLDANLTPMMPLPKFGGIDEDKDSATATLRNFLLSAQAKSSILEDFYLVLAQVGGDSFLLHSQVRALVDNAIYGFNNVKFDSGGTDPLLTMVEDGTSNILGTSAFFLKRHEKYLGYSKTFDITVPNALAISEAVFIHQTTLKRDTGAAEADARDMAIDFVDQSTSSMLQPTQILSRDGFSLAFAEEPTRNNQEAYKLDATKAARAWGSYRSDPELVSSGWTPSSEAFGRLVGEKYGQNSG